MIALLIGAAAAIPREEVLDNAALYASHVWTSSASNQDADACYDGDYESDYPPGEYTGLPYDWGGYVTLAEFDDELDEGYGAGSHSWHGSLWCTTGVDCSGFVSMIWETDHYATSTFADGPTHEIGWDELTRADAVNDAGSHVVLFAHETDAGWPVFYEAAGSASKVRINAASGWSYLDGYQPIRFDDIEEGTSSGTRGEPREITSFPYSDFRWTAGAASDVLDSYSCAPDTDESGPEVLYRFEAATRGLLEVVVSDDVGVDVDVHVLTAVDGEACLARDDTDVSVTVGPGTVWIAVDTWVGDQEYPGAYLLSATFDGTVGESVETDDTGTVAEDTDPPEEEATPQDRDRDPPQAHRLEAPESAGCGCESAPAPGWLALLLGLLSLRRQR